MASMHHAQVPKGKSYEFLAYGAHGVIAAGLGRDVHMIDSASGSVLSVIEDAHTKLTYLQWSPVPRRIGECALFVEEPTLGEEYMSTDRYRQCASHGCRSGKLSNQYVECETFDARHPLARVRRWGGVLRPCDCGRQAREALAVAMMA